VHHTPLLLRQKIQVSDVGERPTEKIIIIIIKIKVKKRAAT